MYTKFLEIPFKNCPTGHKVECIMLRHFVLYKSLIWKYMGENLSMLRLNVVQAECGPQVFEILRGGWINISHQLVFLNLIEHKLSLTSYQHRSTSHEK